MESIVQWDASYNVGDETIDQQHQKLFDIFNRLYALVESGASKEDGEQAFLELLDYTDVHFTDEIEFYTASELPTLENHKLLHRDLHGKLLGLYKDYNTLENPVFEAEEWIRTLLLPHILEQDMEAMRVLNRKEALKWESSYNVGDDTIDEQHQKLFDLYNELHHLNEQGAGQEDGKKALHALLDYTEFHFSDEIEFYTASRLETLDEHKEFHKQLYKDISLLYDDYYLLDNPILEAEEWVKNKLLPHILEYDMKAIIWIKAQPAA
ncbi:bacteriohemerythrin [Magnetococcus sp. PR-3]|uniref:bacteriohemerythrin n=1 Tax=Magnetococcus sp. PR-3 TaxID=3120355 RepID=UPI002FCDE33C